MSEASERWARRVEEWRASGEEAEEFSRRAGYAANTLKWWASRLKTQPEFRLARVQVKPSTVPTSPTPIRSGLIVIEVPRARIAVESGADRATLAMVLELLGAAA
jgi:hypothetical protein